MRKLPHFWCLCLGVAMNLRNRPVIHHNLSPLLLAVLSACASTIAAPDAVDNSQLISVYASTGGPGPRITSLEIGDAGSIVYGYLGESKSCSGVLRQRDLHELREAINDASDIFIFLAVADYAASFSDMASVDFALPKPPGPGLSSEIVVPEELFPVSLLPLMSLLDKVALRACGAQYRPRVLALRH